MTGALYGSTTAGVLLPPDLRHLHPPHRLLEREDGGTQRLGRIRALQSAPSALRRRWIGARVQLRDARFVDADLGADLLHRRFGVVVERDHPALARRQRGDRGADAVADFLLFEGASGAVGSDGTSAAGSVAPSTFSPADSGDVDSMVVMRTMVRPSRASSEPTRCGQVGERRLGAELAAQLLAGGLELAALAAHAARPGVAAQRVDHRAADAALGEGLELDAARFVEAARRVDQAEHAVLHEIAELDRVRHRRGDPPREGLDEWKAGGDSFALTGFEWLTLLVAPFARTGCPTPRRTAAPRDGDETLKRNGNTTPKAMKKRSRETPCADL